MSHTKEPWYASKEGDNWRVMAADENGGYTLADMCCDDQEANARRIVAWDKRRGFPIPYKVRDPAHAAIASAKGGAA